MQDFLGYKRDIKPNGQIMTGELATLSIGGTRSNLVQQVAANYGQAVMPKFEVGSPTLYWLTGQPMGMVTFSRIVGCSGFLSALSGLRGSCDTLVPIQIGSDGQTGCATAQCGGGSISFDGGVVESVNVTFSAGTLEVAEGATIKVAAMG